MAKYDHFKASETFPDGNKQGYVEISVLFEAGDSPREVMEQTKSLLAEHIAEQQVEGTGLVSRDGLAEYLRALSIVEVREVLVDYWIDTMVGLGSGRYEFTNQIGEDLKTARLAANELI